MVIYSDILFNIDLEKFIKFHKKKKSDLTLFTHPNNHPHDSDLIEVNNSSQVVKFHKKPHKNKNFNNLCLSGIYIINKKLLKILKKNKYQDFSKDFLPKIIKNKFKVYSYRSRDYVKDIGTPGPMVISGAISISESGGLIAVITNSEGEAPVENPTIPISKLEMYGSKTIESAFTTPGDDMFVSNGVKFHG